MLFISFSIQAQYSWDFRDPNDLNIIDFGDNKVLLYNAIGIGLALLLSEATEEKATITHSFTFEYVGEYRKEALSNYWAVTGRRNYPIRMFLDAGAEVKSSFVKDDDRNVFSIGFSPFFSWHIVKRGRFRLSYDNGVGPMVISSAFPESGTQFNFYTFYGLEMSTSIKSISIIFGIRNTHISNADIKGRERNPSFDGLGFYFGCNF